MSKTLLGPLFRRLRDQSEPSAASRFEYRYEYDRDHDSGLAEESPPQRTRPPPAARPLAPLPPSLPAYSPATHNQAEESRWRNPSGKRGHISSLPLGLLYSILALTLDPAATPNRRAYLDPENEPLLRTAELFRLRAVDRRFFLAATAILRDRLRPTYTALLLRGASSDAHPPGGDGADPASHSVYAARSRETAVLDRFIALRVGEDLRRAESALCEDSGEQYTIFSVLQPAARTEDLLLQLPPTLVTPYAPQREPERTFPLPHTHLVIQNSPLWTQLYLSSVRVDIPSMQRGAKRTLLVEICRQPTPEETAANLCEALDHIRQSRCSWGDRLG